MDSEQIGKALRLDWFRLTQINKALSAPALLALALVLSIIARLTRNGLVGAIVFAIFFIMPATSGIYLSAYQKKTSSGPLNGMLPATRLNQVVARYFLVFLLLMMTFVAQLVCMSIMYLPGYPLFVFAASLLELVVGIIFNALVLPVGYRFDARKAAIVMLLVLMAVVLLMSLDPNRYINGIMSFKLFSVVMPMPWTSVFWILIAIVLFVVSCLASVSIYEHKEM
ncbi:ABC-2 transporter permease [Bifidobacterium sp. ESL0790]|uniref:ABC-2 transporter permease n=1 Tax=Bifidobacterium sp. ESL0790 TaxID=2983233 RepID=UPI0023F85CA9|nr:ABC-2 transporter permease [Bifidobacterium sp. ESL0790]WEV71786.1 ABC-2 transporter permease [Bifidobacterium sp. ESL0790]